MQSGLKHRSLSCVLGNSSRSFILRAIAGLRSFIKSVQLGQYQDFLSIETSGSRPAQAQCTLRYAYVNEYTQSGIWGNLPTITLHSRQIVMEKVSFKGSNVGRHTAVQSITF